MSCKFFEEVPKKSDISLENLQIVLYGMYINTLFKPTPDSIKQIGEDSNSIEKNQFYVKDEILERYTNKEWNSANRLMELSLETFDDLLNHNGVAYKTLVNAFIENENNQKIEILGNKKEVKEVSNEDRIIKLVEDLKMTKNRREKRVLLAKFNREVGFGFGEYKRINKNKFENEEPEEEKNKDEKTEKKINNNKYNTVVISQKKIENIEKFDNKLINQKFTQKIDFKKQKALALEGQQNLSLRLNQGSTERTIVAVPTVDYERGYELAEDKEAYVRRMEVTK
jgi:hypothetical protein